MKRSFVKFAFAVLFLVSASFADDFEDALAAVDSAEAANMPGMYDVNHFEYLDCWVESAANIVARERNRIGAIRDEAKVCGCYTIREKGGYGWRATDEGKKIVKVWDIPKPRLLTCPKGMTCSDEFFIEQCVDHIKQSVPMLSDYAKGAPLEGAIALTFEDKTKTPFGEYLESHKAAADSINCFINVHNRPDAAFDSDNRNPFLFHLSGMPRKLIPSAVGRFTDYSDVRCLDRGILTGFANNGYVENVRHVDANGLLYGEEIGYMNDPTYPKKQGPEWGGILWKSNYRMGMREGISTFYRSSVLDQKVYGTVDSSYYFQFLEVPYTQGYVNGTARMFSDKGFVMAEIPYKRNAMHGRMTVYNPFKKKPVALTFNANSLEGFVDFGEFGGVFHKGLPNGVITFWTVKDTCYQWMPGETVCYSERITKKQWGTYKMGEFQGVMECADGTKGGKDLICPDLDSAAVKKIAINADIAVKEKERAKAEALMKDAEEDLAKQKEADSLKAAEAAAADSAAQQQAAPAPQKSSEEEMADAIQKGKSALAAKKSAKAEPAPAPAAEEPHEPTALEKAEKAKLEAQKALQEAEKALAEAKKAEREAIMAEQKALKAERQAKKAKAGKKKDAAKPKKSSKKKK
ncbi:hypothetical protein SAMN05720487_10228 [Fibrobacter sp. UWT2]|uniref:hypothetical protein n=1 Tax=Fibrobacter sp. UWT2 TaxID=1896224 RepID=UPI0009218834|nr:hypothetical protein [Fibrobacter sp. UWT2]SHK47575.1 hypothetical protein SAMN05720487_10228 [Fibrobacter sp. UWT2]